MNKIIEEIIDWSKNRPLWQQDALRRLIESSRLTEESIQELAKICTLDKGWEFSDEQISKPMPFKSKLAISDTGMKSSVSILNIKNIKNINALVDNQVLEFSKNGLNIIYGDNGTGKSGYARILKRACRARSRGDLILSNIYNERSDEPAKAKITYSRGDSEEEVEWRDGETSIEDLLKINFFDSECAIVHVSGVNEISFTPFGLDLLVRLVEVCLAVKENLNNWKEKIEKIKNYDLEQWGVCKETKTYNLLVNLSKDTKKEEIEKMAILSLEEKKRIIELKSLLSGDPKIKASEMRLKKDRLTELFKHISTAEEKLSQHKIELLKLATENYFAKEKTAKAAANMKFEKEPIPNIGNECWKTLWESARKFSILYAYRGEDFPYTKSDSRCVLCQQTLDNDSCQRLHRFEKFIRDDTKIQAEEAKGKLDDLIGELNRLFITTFKNKDSLRELKIIDERLYNEIRRYLICFQLLRKDCFKSVKNNQWDAQLKNITSPLNALKSVIDDLEKKALAFDTVSVSGEINKLQKELDEFESRKTIQIKLKEIKEEINRLKKITILEDAIQETNTSAITRKSSELINRHVFENVKNRFLDELEKLGIKTVKIFVDSAGGEYATKRYKLSLEGAISQVNPFKILSEGECKCIAIASFLAESSMSTDLSTIVFDDPISSLDHFWRGRVAERLCEESVKRQVIVFTHDIIFLKRLIEYSEKNQFDYNACRLELKGRKPGYCLKGLPWHGMSVKERIGKLKDCLQITDKIFKEKDSSQYEQLARNLYGALRETWERAIEEVLLNKVVERFSREIQTKRLKKIINDITENDYTIIDKAMIKCSTHMCGHDSASELQEPVPNPDEIKQDIEILENWISDLRNRGRGG